MTFDIALKRGVLVRGRVTDKATGRPVVGLRQRLHLRRQPPCRRVPRLSGELRPYARLEDDGRYEVVTLPGRGIIACRSDLGRYRGGVGAEAIKGYDPKDRIASTRCRISAT